MANATDTSDADEATDLSDVVESDDGPWLRCDSDECGGSYVETLVLQIGCWRYIQCAACGETIKEREVDPE